MTGGIEIQGDVRSQEGARWWLSRWIPALFFLFSVGILLLSWRAFLSAEASARKMETRVTGEQVGLRLEAWIDTRLSVVEQVARRWPREFDGHPEQFRKSALNLIALYPGFQALNWIDDQWVIRIIVPEPSNEPALGKDLHGHPNIGVRRALQRSRSEYKLSATSVIDLLQGGKGFATYLPVTGASGKILGYINGVFRIDTLVDACLAEEGLRRRFRYQLLDENGVVAYSQGFKKSRVERKNLTMVPVHVGDRVWKLQMAGSGAAENGASEALAAVLLAISLVLAAILALVLAALMQRHRAYERGVRVFREVVNHLRELVVRIDGQGRVLYASPAYVDLLGRKDSLPENHDVLLFIHGGDREASRRSLEQLQEPPHVMSVEQRILCARTWHRISWMLMGLTDDEDRIQILTVVGRDFSRDSDDAPGREA